MRLRHHLYDRSLLSSFKSRIPVISIGNLSFGGVGKTPMVEYLVEHFKDKCRVAVLSRGYGRKTTGFIKASDKSSAEEIGDEPCQYIRKFPNIQVAVDADRARGIRLLEDTSDLIILDDAMQHRAVRAGLSLLLTTYGRPYFQDELVPAGYLRDIKSRASAAQIIIVTKCPPDLLPSQAEAFRQKLKLKAGQEAFFCTISYADYLISDDGRKPLESLKTQKFTLVTGIANPKPLTDFLSHSGFDFEHFSYPDHHYFSRKELSLLGEKKLIVTTEKDYMRLHHRLKHIYYLPIKMAFLYGEEDFLKKVSGFVN